MKKFLVPILVVVFALILTWMGVQRGKADERAQQEKAAYHKLTDSLTVQLAGALKRRDTVLQRVPVEVVRIIRAAARVDTVTLGFQRDTTTADSLGTALVVIATQDTLIREQAGHITTLGEIVAADSGIIRLFQGQRRVDSLRIGVLEKPAGFRIPLLGIRLKPKCGPGVGVQVYPQISGSVGVFCVL